jgi:hypothetical protein
MLELLSELPSSPVLLVCHTDILLSREVSCLRGEVQATLYLAQPVRHTNGVWVVTRVGDPVSQ